MDYLFRVAGFRDGEALTRPIDERGGKHANLTSALRSRA